MESQLFKGVIVPIVTPMTASGQVDTLAVKRIVEKIIRTSATTLLMGTTGEGTSLTQDQAVSLIRAAREVTPDITPLYVAATDNSLGRLLENAKAYVAAGADGIAVAPPSYYSLTPEQMKEFYTMVADKISVPLFIYNIPIATHTTIPIDTILELAQHPNIHGIKDSDKDVDRMKEMLERLHKAEKSDGLQQHFQYFCGCAANSYVALRHGADGIVPSLGNYWPEAYQNIYRAVADKHYEEAERWQQITIEVSKINTEGFTLGESLAGLKVIMKERGLCEEYMLSPLTELSEEKKEEVKQRYIAARSLISI